MSTLKKIFTFLGFFLISITTFAETGGSQDGGGGTMVRLTDGRSLLVDLYVASPLIQDTRAARPVLGNVTSPDGRQRLRDKFSMRARNQDFYQDLRPKLERLSTSSPIVAHTLREALDTMTFLAIEGPIGDSRTPSFFVPAELQSNIQETRAVALYSERFNGPVISLDAYNQLGFLSRQALFIHEAFRHIESDSSGGRDQEIQQLTAAVILNSSTATLDNETLFDGSLMQSLLAVNSFGVKKIELCSGIQALIPQAEMPYELRRRMQEGFCENSDASFSFFAAMWSAIGYNAELFQSLPPESRPRFNELRDLSRASFFAAAAARLSDNNLRIRQLTFELNYSMVRFE